MSKASQKLKLLQFGNARIDLPQTPAIMPDDKKPRDTRFSRKSILSSEEILRKRGRYPFLCSVSKKGWRPLYTPSLYALYTKRPFTIVGVNVGFRITNRSSESDDQLGCS